MKIFCIMRNKSGFDNNSNVKMKSIFIRGLCFLLSLFFVSTVVVCASNYHLPLICKANMRTLSEIHIYHEASVCPYFSRTSYDKTV